MQHNFSEQVQEDLTDFMDVYHKGDQFFAQLHASLVCSEDILFHPLVKSVPTTNLYYLEHSQAEMSSLPRSSKVKSSGFHSIVVK